MIRLDGLFFFASFFMISFWLATNYPFITNNRPIPHTTYPVVHSYFHWTVAILFLNLSSLIIHWYSSDVKSKSNKALLKLQEICMY